eukprot:TRINITY_DN9872_c0_g3_i1.p1 TRINITY_DN9872_c0_g3~~TRINITY_DN9872_c0_g3_i1.p1  ORF type:complete len:595 (-),score=81.76 TRINITY_DN9872_c0_g3_i1:476-2260(-)
MKATANESRLVAVASVVGGGCLVLIFTLQLWAALTPASSPRSKFSGSTRYRPPKDPCGNSTEPARAYVYDLNPKHGTEFAGKGQQFWNASLEAEIGKRCEDREKRLLERDETRRRLRQERAPEARASGEKGDGGMGVRGMLGGLWAWGVRGRRLLEQHETQLRPTVRQQKTWKESQQARGRGKPGPQPLFGKIFPDGLYYIAMGLGNPLRTYYLDIDTGSDLSWLSCDAPCVSCARGPHAWYKPTSAQLVDCHEPLCSRVQTDGGPSAWCEGGAGAGAGQVSGAVPAQQQQQQQCDYDVHYGDGSSSQGVLVKDLLAFQHPDGRVLPAQVAFGCAYDQAGALAHSPSKTDGIIGLGSGAISFPSQLAAQGLIDNVVGHCISAGAAGGGYFFLGSELVPPDMTWVAMLGKPAADYYYVSVQGIKYGSDSTRLPIDAAVFSLDRGGTILDSGSSFTYLATPAFNAVLKAITAGLALSGLQHDSSDHRLPHCWGAPRTASHAFRSVAEAVPFFSSLQIEISGGGWFSPSGVLTLDPEGYLLLNSKGRVCLGVLDAGALTPGGAANILGDISLRGYLVVYDNERYRVGWMRRDCSLKP